MAEDTGGAARRSTARSGIESERFGARPRCPAPWRTPSAPRRFPSDAILSPRGLNQTACASNPDERGRLDLLRDRYSGLAYGAAHPAPGRLSSQRRRRLLDHRSEEHTSELQSLRHLVCRLLLE